MSAEGSMPLLEIDRIQIVVPDRPEAAARWQRLLDAELVREDRVAALGCRRSVLAVGTSEVELLCADGAGAVEQAGPGLFAAGFGVDDTSALESRLTGRGVEVTRQGEQLFIAPEAIGDRGLRVVVSPLRERARVGLIQRLYETTLLVPDAAAYTARFAELFGLDPTPFVPIRSENFGYDGTLTLFRPGHLDRVEIITPYDLTKTMGRYFHKRGPCLYMAYAECDRSDEVRARALEHAPKDWTGPTDGPLPDNQFLHPRALGGAMLGVSRTTFAWSWSGAPERVRPA
jgi:hypothetical protein